jgi:hypothetical protein
MQRTLAISSPFSAANKFLASSTCYPGSTKKKKVSRQKTVGVSNHPKHKMMGCISSVYAIF